MGYFVIHGINKHCLLMIVLLLCAPAARAGLFQSSAGSCELAAAGLASPEADLVPVTGLTAQDMPYDAGGAALVKWSAMPYDGGSVTYRVFAASAPYGPWTEATAIPADKSYTADIKLPFWAWNGSGAEHAVKVDILKMFPAMPSAQAEALAAEFGGDRTKFTPRQAAAVDAADAHARREYEDLVSVSVYYFKVTAERGSQSMESGVVSAVPKANWFSLPRLNSLIYAIILCALFVWFIARAKRKTYFLRRLPGLDALDEAIGRAAETGRPVYYMTGRMDISSMSTIAATFILSEVAKKTAAYDAGIKVPHTDPLTMTVCQEVVKQSYTEAGRADSYREDMNFFLTTDQFAFTAAVDGLITRDRPAACIYTGYYYAESLLLTEVGASVGAIQIAATDAEHQLPFFFTTCDYTLMGEELYAAGAYLSRDPVLVGTLRGQDMAKLAVMAVLALGIIAVTLGTLHGWTELVRVVKDPVTAF